MDVIHIKDTSVGHPWNVAEILEHAVVYRFTRNKDGLSSNSGAPIKWLHALKEEYFLSTSKKQIESFQNLYGKHISVIHIKYGEVVGVSGKDVTFLPADILEIILM